MVSILVASLKYVPVAFQAIQTYSIPGISLRFQDTDEENDLAIEQLLQVITPESSISFLELNGVFSDIGYNMIATALMLRPGFPIKELRFGICTSDNGLSIILYALRYNTTVSKIKYSYSQLTDKIIESFIENTPSITTLELNNIIANEYFEPYVSIIEKRVNSSDQTLHIFGNFLDCKRIEKAYHNYKQKQQTLSRLLVGHI